MTAAIPTLASQYDPFATEAKWQTYWEDQQVFKADPSRAGAPYCIVIPPPNVNGSLHMGHAFNTTLIDVLVRYHRMRGDNTLCLPGTDHASIAVQTLLEKQLKQEGKTRDDLGREQFLEKAWQWKAETGGTIVGQLRRLGLSADWSRERFTMDEMLSQAVQAEFIQLYEQGLIYRGKYLVNWCPASQSAVSDLEVENQEVNGHLWHFRYPLTDGSGYVEVATTRPETMLGDTAVAVNPNDERYREMIGKTLRLPIMNREIPVIADDYVDATFGTGCVKVTPAHDPNDFEMGKRHNLPMINILNKNGSLNENAGEFQGQDRFVARKNVVQRLEQEGFLVKVEDYKHMVPYSDRGKVPVEPLLSTQWFVKIRPLADKALDFLDNKGEPRFVPERWAKVYRDWLVNLRDWCISRQLWWGHQIPAWYVVSQTNGEITDETPFVIAATAEAAREKAVAQFGEEVQLEQDPDVLDTWFSSGLWPFSTLGWPNQTADLERYYPTSVLVTGFDIIFFWVARMTMLGGQFTDTMPFADVYIHGLVRDENNKKMSKSANNGIDPLLLIGKYGTDALRYTLIKEVAGAGQDIRLEYNRKTDESASVEASRNFTNKLWNASRFVIMNLGDYEFASLTASSTALSSPDAQLSLELADRWILSRYHQVVQQTRQSIETYSLGEAAKGLYEFIWGDFCDWYIELVKSRLQSGSPDSKRVAQQTLAVVLEGILKLLHPFMPHITEELWHTLTQAGDQRSLALASYPEANANLIDLELEQQFELLIGAIRTIRNLRAEADIKPGVKIQTALETEDERERQILLAGQSYIQDLAKVEQLTIAAPASSTASEAAQNGSATKLNSQSNSATGRFAAYRKPLITLGYLLVLLILIRIGLGILTAIDSLILVAPLLKLIGAGYTAWFIYRFASNQTIRQELFDQIRRFRQKATEAASAAVPTPIPTTAVSVSSPSREISGGQQIAGVIGTVQVSIPLAGVVDVEMLRAKLQKDLNKIEAEIASLSQRLSNSSFVDKAPADVVQNARGALAEAEKQAEILRERLAHLNA
jgi:valyl-tRNA synthetase